MKSLFGFCRALTRNAFIEHNVGTRSINSAARQVLAEKDDEHKSVTCWLATAYVWKSIEVSARSGPGYLGWLHAAGHEGAVWEALMVSARPNRKKYAALHFDRMLTINLRRGHVNPSLLEAAVSSILKACDPQALTDESSAALPLASEPS